MNLIKAWSQYRGISPARLATIAGISPQAINDLLKEGVRHRDSTKLRFAEIFGVTYEEFVSGPPACISSSGEKLDDADRIEKVVEVAHRLEGEALKKLYVYALYLEGQSRMGDDKKNMHNVS